MKAVLAAVALMAACGDNTTITIGFPDGALAFATYKADGGWHHPEATSTGYRIDRAGPYQFVWVCSQNGVLDIEELFADTSDGDQDVAPVIDSACYPDGTPVVSGALGRISGSVVQAGMLSVGSFGTDSFMPDWTYDLEATQGVHDVVFVPEYEASHVVVRRDVTVGDMPNVQPAIDLTAEGTALVPVPVAIEGLAVGEQVVSHSVLVANEEPVQLVYGDATVGVLPSQELGPADYQLVYVSASNGEADEDAYFSPDLTRSVAFIPPPTVSFTTSDTGIAATWAHASVGTVGFELSVSDGTSVIHGHILPSVAGEHVLDLAIDPDIQGFADAWRPAWSHDLDAARVTFKVTALRDHACYATRVTHNGSAPIWGANCG